MDTTHVILPEIQIDKIINAITEGQTDFLLPGQIALLAALIGALAALVPQLIIHLLERRKDKIGKINELKGEERRISFLLTEYYKEVVMHKVHKQYWFKASILKEFDKDDRVDSHQRHFSSNQRSFKSLNKIRETMSEYFKIVTLYINLTNDNKIITNALKEIKSFKPRKASEYPDVNTYDDLLKETKIDEDELNNEYLFYSEKFDEIYNEMKQ